MKYPATTKYLDMMKAQYFGASDYRIAQLLGVSKNAVSKWRRDVAGMSEDIGMIVADRLDLDVVVVVTELNRDRATTRAAREYYDRILSHFKPTAALALPFLLSLQALTDQLRLTI